MNLYIWNYKARVAGGRGFIKGRVEAPSYSHAEQAIKDNNLMVNSVAEIKLDRSPTARNQSYEAWQGVV